MQIIDGDVIAPKGFFATSVHANIRKNRDKADLAVIYSDVPATAAGVFTQNQVKAAPVILSQERIQRGLLQAIVVNSGNANACTGELGMQHANDMINGVATGMDIDPAYVAVASTGVIGQILPIENIKTGIAKAVTQIKSNDNGAAIAIMTTDTFPKTMAVEFMIDDTPVRIGGISKGSGMIHPNMATMLGFVTTDIAISQTALQRALTLVNQTSFNMITVDGDSSTNDMVLILANGLAKNTPILTIDDPRWTIFYNALSFVCKELAKQIAKDGEGASKFIEVQVRGAASEAQAQLAARAVCRSPLVKTAFYGEDANWGRIACALGASGADLNIDQFYIEMAGLSLLEKGTPVPFDEAQAKQLLGQNSIVVKVDLGNGEAEATAWGCDLTHGYIDINASYRS